MKSLEVGVPPFNCTFMGMMRGVADAFGNPISNPMLYGGSGHAFVIHIHKELCPSGPYCWDRSPVFGLLRNIGLVTEDLGFFGGDAPASRREAVEARLRAEIDAGRPAGLVNMEFQLITGYDETGFLTSQPWPGHDFPPRHLTFGTWSELGHEVHVNFFALAPCDPIDTRRAIAESLRFAIGLYDEPGTYAGPHYGMGPEAYHLWKDALAQHGISHGNWWNATVYAECRRRAGEYFLEVARLTGLAAAEELTETYARVSAALCNASERDASVESKRHWVELAEATEQEAIVKVRILLKALDATQ
ncbi:MAG: hypothetical protein P4L46_02390 [Fimbriimonas sp.]|nr:hypothetical protein [Fimbriimonas sp.]